MATSATICRLCQSAAAMCCCTCVSPVLPICSNCMLTHLGAAGTHVIQPLPPPTTKLPDVFNEFCWMCHSAIPETVCCCETTGVLLCGKCIFEHNSNNMSKVHILLPIKARPFVSTPGYLERLRGRQTALDGGLAEARRSITTVEKCEQEVVDRTEKAIEAIRKYREDRLAELKTVREDLERSIAAADKDIREHIFEDSYVPSAHISKELWNYRPGQLTLFSYSFDGLYEVRLCTNPQDRVPVRPAPPQLGSTPKLTPTASPRSLSPRSSTSQDTTVPLLRIQPYCITHFNPASNSFGRQTALHPGISITHMTSAAVLPNGKLFVCGKENPVSNVAFEIDLQSGCTKVLADMITKRFAHAVVAYKNCVYVFGGTGVNSLLRDCEKFTLSTNDWKRLASMRTARDFFNPCTIRQFVLILGGRGTNLCEKYDIGNDCFTDLSIRMPAVGHTVAVVRDERTVLVIQSGSVFSWTQDSSELIKERNVPSGAMWGTMPAVLIGASVYIPQSYQARVLRIPL